MIILVFRIGEEHIDAVTGISGSGPAYMYLILEAITEEGVSLMVFFFIKVREGRMRLF